MLRSVTCNRLANPRNPAGKLRALVTVAGLAEAQAPNDGHARLLACRPKGADSVGDSAGNGDNSLCCSDRCTWVNEKQAYLCE